MCGKRGAGQAVTAEYRRLDNEHEMREVPLGRNKTCPYRRLRRQKLEGRGGGVLDRGRSGASRPACASLAIKAGEQRAASSWRRGAMPAAAANGARDKRNEAREIGHFSLREMKRRGGAAIVKRVMKFMK